MADEALTVKLPSPLVRWSYQALPRVGRCRLADDEMYVSLTLTAAPASEVPDVRAVDAWLKGFLAGPTTAEEVALAAAARWKVAATVEASAASHGPIVCRAEPKA